MSTTEHWTTIVLIAIGIAATVPVGLHTLGVSPFGGRRALFAAALASIAGLTVPPGLIAAALTLPWLVLAGATVAQAMAQMRARHDLDSILQVAALGWWFNAGLWLLAHRLGTEPLGFDRTITLLTVGHFHHAGFGLTAMLLMMRRRVELDRMTTSIAITHQAGMVMVAAGITFSDHLEVLGAATITIALAGWAALAIGPLRRSTDRRLVRGLFTISAIAWIVPMALAIAWSLGPFLTEPVVRTFQVMLDFHAAINSIGLVLAGLIAFRLTPVGITLTITTAEGRDDDLVHTTHT